MVHRSTGVIHCDEAYSKQTVLERLGVSQKFWDQMLADGLPYTPIGHARWVLGSDLLEYLKKNSRRVESEAS